MNKITFFGLAFVATATALTAQDASPKSGQEQKPAEQQDAKGAGAPQAPKAATTDPNYVIGPEDELSVNVWREADISRTVPVRPDGKISLPLVNDVQAAGLTPMQLGMEVTTRLKKFIAEPQVTIIVLRINSQRIFLIGEVNHPGAFPLLPNMTVLEAITTAGGLSPFAKQSKIHVMRKEDGKQITLPFNFKEALKGIHPEQNIVLKAGDTVVVP